ncbi:MAG: hypothetical protein HQL65_14650 [Magnetococcales bacterium]|nr:hypothetical protein [Magnetococcales bacterium]
MIITYEPISLESANACLIAWEHRRGVSHGLLLDGEPMAVSTTDPAPAGFRLSGGCNA